MYHKKSRELKKSQSHARRPSLSQGAPPRGGAHANVDLHNSIFRWQLTFNAGMRSFRDAVLRWGHSHVLLYTSRRYTNPSLPCCI